MMIALTQPSLNQPWDEEHIKALLRFPRYPLRLLQTEPWQTWLNQRGGLANIYKYLHEYAFVASQQRILAVILASPEATADFYADQLSISRTTYFHRLNELLPAVAYALNTWQIDQPLTLATHSKPTLPQPLTSLVGVESTLSLLKPLLLQPQVRLLTLLGHAGVGKSRLALALAQQTQFTACWYLDLANITTITAIEPALISLIQPTSPTLSGLIQQLDQQSTLLIFDNAEHLFPLTELLENLLSSAASLKILLTSRRAMQVYGEYEYQVQPLAIPHPADYLPPSELAEIPAVQLYLQRVQAVNPQFQLDQTNAQAISELSIALEGLPLAIELAALQSKFFAPQALLNRINQQQRLNILQRPQQRSARQQTLRGTLDWSFGLLEPDLQSLFSRLAVFAGGSTIEAAAVICASLEPQPEQTSGLRLESLPQALDQVQAGLMALVDQSLLQQTIASHGEPRFQMLEVTREYALQQLNNRGETLLLQRGYALYYLRLAEHIMAWQAPQLFQRRTEILQQEYRNFKAAIQWALDHHEADLSVRLVVLLWDFWTYYGHQQEGRQIAEAVIAQTASLQSPLRAQLLRLVGWLAHDLGEYTLMHHSFQASVEMAEGMADHHSLGLSLHGLGELAQMHGNWQQAQSQLQQSFTIFQNLEQQELQAWSLEHLGRLALSQGQFEQAYGLFHKSLDLFQLLDSSWGAMFALGHLGQVALYQADFAKAQHYLEECLQVSTATGANRSAMVCQTLNYLGELALQQQRLEQASELLHNCLNLSHEIGYRGCIELANYSLGLLALNEGKLAQARNYLHESLHLQQALNEQWRALLVIEASAEYLSQHQPQAAACLYLSSEHLRQSLAIQRPPLYQAKYQQLTQLLIDDLANTKPLASLESALDFAIIQIR